MLVQLSLSNTRLEEKFFCEACSDKRMVSMDCSGKVEESGKRGNPIPLAGNVTLLTVYRCPMAVLNDNPEAIGIWNAYNVWRVMKSMPEPGGTDNQDARFIQACLYISEIVNRIETNKRYMAWKRTQHSEDMNIDGKGNKQNQKQKKFRSFGDIARTRKG